MLQASSPLVNSLLASQADPVNLVVLTATFWKEESWNFTLKKLGNDDIFWLYCVEYI